MTSLRPVIFDMDGVISDTQIVHATAEAEVLRSMFQLEACPNDISARFAGRSTRALLDGIFSGAGRPTPSIEEEQSFRV